MTDKLHANPDANPVEAGTHPNRLVGRTGNKGQRMLLAALAFTALLPSSTTGASKEEAPSSQPGQETNIPLSSESLEATRMIGNYAEARMTRLVEELEGLEECTEPRVISEILAEAPDKRYFGLIGQKIRAFRPVEEIVETYRILYTFNPSGDPEFTFANVYDGRHKQEVTDNAVTVAAVVNSAIGPILSSIPENARPAIIKISQGEVDQKCYGDSTIVGGSANPWDDRSIELTINHTGEVDASDLFDVAAHESFHFLFDYVAGLKDYDGREFEYEPYFALDSFNEVYARIASLDNHWMEKHLTLLLEDSVGLSADQTGAAGRSLGSYCLPGRVTLGLEGGDTTFSMFKESRFKGIKWGGHPSSAPEELYASAANILYSFPSAYIKMVESLPDGARRQLAVEVAAATMDLTKIATDQAGGNLADIFDQRAIDFIRAEQERLVGQPINEQSLTSAYCYYDLTDNVLAMIGLERTEETDRQAQLAVTDGDRQIFADFVQSARTNEEMFAYGALNLRLDPTVGAFEVLEWQDVLTNYGVEVRVGWLDPATFVSDLEEMFVSGRQIDQPTALQILTHPAFLSDRHSESSYLRRLSEIHRFSYEDLLVFSSRHDFVDTYSGNGPREMADIIREQTDREELRATATKLASLIAATTPYQVLPGPSYESLNYWLSVNSDLLVSKSNAL